MIEQSDIIEVIEIEPASCCECDCGPDCPPDCC
jgi:hypothetical protein